MQTGGHRWFSRAACVPTSSVEFRFVCSQDCSISQELLEFLKKNRCWVDEQFAVSQCPSLKCASHQDCCQCI